jgi:hypothetical protein
VFGCQTQLVSCFFPSLGSRPVSPPWPACRPQHHVFHGREISSEMELSSIQLGFHTISACRSQPDTMGVLLVGGTCPTIAVYAVSAVNLPEFIPRYIIFRRSRLLKIPHVHLRNLVCSSNHFSTSPVASRLWPRDAERPAQLVAPKQPSFGRKKNKWRWQW